MIDRERIEFGRRLRELRGEQSQADFATRTGINHTSYGLYERGARSPDLDFLIRLHKATGASLDWLAGIRPAQDLSLNVLRSVVMVVEEETPNIDPESKAKLIFRLYSDRIKGQTLGTEADSPKVNKAS
jgi:transcriptional regulator with XRE-family HTH domain